jgi:hypothetical protein
MIKVLIIVIFPNGVNVCFDHLFSLKMINVKAFIQGLKLTWVWRLFHSESNWVKLYKYSEKNRFYRVQCNLYLYMCNQLVIILTIDICIFPNAAWLHRHFDFCKQSRIVTLARMHAGKVLHTIHVCTQCIFPSLICFIQY